MHLRVSIVGPTCTNTNVGWGSLILKLDSWNGLCAGEGEKDHTTITMPWFAIYSWFLPWPLRNRKYSPSILCSTDVDVAGSVVDGFCLLLLTRMPLIKLWLEAKFSIINIHWYSPVKMWSLLWKMHVPHFMIDFYLCALFLCVNKNIADKVCSATVVFWYFWFLIAKKEKFGFRLKIIEKNLNSLLYNLVERH